MVQSVCEAVEEVLVLVLVLMLVVETVKESSAPSNWGIVGVRVSRTPTPSPRVSLLHSWAVEGGKVVSGRPDGGGWVLSSSPPPSSPVSEGVGLLRTWFSWSLLRVRAAWWLPSPCLAPGVPAHAGAAGRGWEEQGEQLEQLLVEGGCHGAPGRW